MPTTSSGPGPRDEEQRQRRGELEERAGVRHRLAEPRRREVVGDTTTNMRRRSDALRTSGLFTVITGMT